MQCELCGTIIKGAPKRVRIEGAVLQVCPKCATLGVEVAQPRPAEPKRKAAAATPAAPQRRGRDIFDMMVGEVVEDFGERIKSARLAKNWTQKDLANEIKEREILIRKIEKAVGVVSFLPFEVNLWAVQNLFHDLVERDRADHLRRAEAGEEASRRWLRAIGELGERLAFRVD